MIHNSHFYCTHTYRLSDLDEDPPPTDGLQEWVNQKIEVLFGLKEQHSSQEYAPEVFFRSSEESIVFCESFDSHSWSLDYKVPENCHFCSNNDISVSGFMVEFVSSEKSSSVVPQSNVEESHKINHRGIGCCRECTEWFYQVRKYVFTQHKNVEVVSWVI